MVENEPQLLALYAQQQDPDAFRSLVEGHQNMVFGVCCRILGNRADAEDAAQNCFFQLARKAARLRAPIGGWLHRVAVNTSIDMLRRKKVRRTAEKARTAQTANGGGKLKWGDVRDVIDEQIAALPARLRQPLVLHYLEGRTQEEIGRTLKISQPAISKRLKRAVGLLRRRLGTVGTVTTAAALATMISANAAAEAAPPALAAAAGKMAVAGLGAGVSAASSGANTATTGGLSMLKATIIGLVVAGAVLTGAIVNRQAEEMVPPAATRAVAGKDSALSFGPVIEDVLYGLWSEEPCLVDLDRGLIFFRPREMERWLTAKLWAWCEQNGIDLLRTSGHLLPLTCVNLAAIPLPSEAWDTCTAQELLNEELLTLARPGSPVFGIAEDNLPVTIAFRTAEGRSGLLQVTHRQAERAYGITIRYKLVQHGRVDDRPTDGGFRIGSPVENLHDAARVGDLPKARGFLDAGADMKARDGERNTPLIIAARHKQAAMCELLIAEGADANAHNRQGEAALTIAASLGHDRTVQLLVEGDADIDYRNGAALRSAAYQGHKTIVEILLAAGADVASGSALMGAAAGGHKEIVELLLARGASVKHTEFYYTTVLSAAAMKGHREVVQLLLAQPGVLEYEKEHGWPSILAATDSGDGQTVEILLDRGADINASRSGQDPVTQNRTPLQHAALHGHRDIVELLLARGARADLRSSNTTTPLACAVIADEPDIITLLAENAEVMQFEKERGWPSVQWAKARRKKNLVDLLVEHGADPNIEPSRQMREWEKGVAGPVVEHTLSKDGTDAFIDFDSGEVFSRPEGLADTDALLDWMGQTGIDAYASPSGQPGVLIGVDILATPMPDDGGWEHEWRSGVRLRSSSFRILTLGNHGFPVVMGGKGQASDRYAFLTREWGAGMLELGRPEGNTTGGVAIRFRMTPPERADTRQLYAAAKMGVPERVRAMLDKGVEPNISPYPEGSPLHEAASWGRIAVAELLLDRGADVNHLGRYGDTPLHHAIMHERTEMVQLLLQRGADTSLKNRNGRRPVEIASDNAEIVALLKAATGGLDIHTAAAAGDLARVKELLKEKPSRAGLRDETGQMPLHYAARQGSLETATLLIASGAEVNAVDEQGNTPLQMAAKGGHKEVAELLRQQGGIE